MFKLLDVCGIRCGRVIVSGQLLKRDVCSDSWMWGSGERKGSRGEDWGGSRVGSPSASRIVEELKLKLS